MIPNLYGSESPETLLLMPRPSLARWAKSSRLQLCSILPSRPKMLLVFRPSIIHIALFDCSKYHKWGMSYYGSCDTLVVKSKCPSDIVAVTFVASTRFGRETDNDRDAMCKVWNHNHGKVL